MCLCVRGLCTTGHLSRCVHGCSIYSILYINSTQSGQQGARQQSIRFCYYRYSMGITIFSKIKHKLWSQEHKLYQLRVEKHNKGMCVLVYWLQYGMKCSSLYSGLYYHNIKPNKHFFFSFILNFFIEFSRHGNAIQYFNY